jgi:signal transduction histidine kinase
MKHSNAKALKVEVAERSLEIRVEITDNGNGFAVTDAQRQNSLGLKTLSERIKIIGGVLEIKSSKNKGTRIIAIIPKK